MNVSVIDPIAASSWNPGQRGRSDSYSEDCKTDSDALTGIREMPTGLFLVEHRIWCSIFRLEIVKWLQKAIFRAWGNRLVFPSSTSNGRSEEGVQLNSIILR